MSGGGKEKALVLIGRNEARELVRAAWEYVEVHGTMPPKGSELLLVSAIDKLTRAFGDEVRCEKRS